MSRRWVRVLVTPELMAGWFENGAEIHVKCIEGVPEGARVTRLVLEPFGNLIVFVFEHESLPEVAEGELMPELVPIFRRLDCGVK